MAEIERHCPNCNALVAKQAKDLDPNGNRGLFLKGRSFRIYGDSLKYRCHNCMHEFSIPLGTHHLTPLLFRQKQGTR